MNLSERGLDLIKSFEGYHTALPDGRCIAYICPAGKVTIGWGCTRGITLGMIWTKDQAEAGLRKELAIHEAAVARLVTVDINSNQRDALISFAYNLGNDALSGSTLLKKLNKGDYVGAQAEFMRWIKHTDPKTGQKVDSRGLAIRRAKEAALFAERTEEENEVKPELIMPQTVAAPKEPMPPAAKGSLIAGGGIVAGKAAEKGAEALIAAPPPAVTDTVANVDVWNKLGKSAETLSTGLWKSPAFATALIVVLIACICGPWAWAKLKGANSQ
jgi:GH24 family phage-related lysozyme (muramidase)